MAEQSKKSNSSGNGLKIIIIVGIVVVVALLAVIIVLLLKNNNKPADTVEEEKRPVVVSQETNAEDIVDEMLQEEYIAPGYYEVKMTTTWNFASGDAESSNAYVANDAGNTNDVYFDIVLAEDESQVIYKSPVIPRGGELENIKLDQSLSAGTYDCVCIYNLVDENQNPVSELRVGLTIVVDK